MKYGFGIIDFKTTNIDPNKSQKYKFQLEAYAQIFTYPGETKKTKTPKLGPINVMEFFSFPSGDFRSWAQSMWFTNAYGLLTSSKGRE